MTERHGVWGKAMAVPGLSRLNAGGYAGVQLMSCQSAGSCTAAGVYSQGDTSDRVFVVSEKNGKWGTAEPIRGLVALGAFDVEVNAPVLWLARHLRHRRKLLPEDSFRGLRRHPEEWRLECGADVPDYRGRGPGCEHRHAVVLAGRQLRRRRNLQHRRRRRPCLRGLPDPGGPGARPR